MNINIRGELFDLSKPKVMGILNLTPDSFYDGGKFKDINIVDNHISKMIKDGMDILDIGGYSSRPGAKEISLKEETNRVLPIVKHIRKKFPDLIISIDTFRSEIANACLNEGADIINDISAGILDKKMLQTISNFNCVYIMMHMLGKPQNMQNYPSYENVVIEIIQFLSERIKIARDNGIVDLISDPGFGFGKTLENNFEILNNLEKFKILDIPILVGFSRKSMIYKTLKTNSENALNGTSALNTIALTKGVKILRVHDVKEAKECIILHEKTISSLF
ncbi:MAG: dihydropteroate synthase [Flavobacteriales bacterium]|nr:dihydropteroate synthase [Flavobacteriales bacterium]|tara:strand:- start:435 stop:1268 length:834 start_codon:yes stop_codon:yes gene_type:complete